MSMRQLLDISKNKRLRGEQDASQDATASQAASDGGPSAEASEPPAQRQRREKELRGEKEAQQGNVNTTDEDMDEEWVRSRLT